MQMKAIKNTIIDWRNVCCDITDACSTEVCSSNSSYSINSNFFILLSFVWIMH